MEEITKYIRAELFAPATALVYAIQVVKKAWPTLDVTKAMPLMWARMLLLLNFAFGLGIARIGRVASTSIMDAWWIQGILLGVWMILFYHGSKWTFSSGNWDVIPKKDDPTPKVFPPDGE